ncbi:MAG: prephenate dehydrogenase/arogenate dehydrogenase family protein [Candidatus Omnitrophica bacterium]|nr:prephenate dehydrogenase/arogenate dehydrogenase family protein [Candidatus Omnitrophota bacterium]
MVFRRHLFRKVVILGTGLIGGSVGLALKKNELAAKIVGTSRHEASLKTALTMKAIDEAEMDLHKAIAGADLVILAAPAKVILENIKDIARHLRRDCIVTDVGSTKGLIVAAAEKHFPPHVLFVGSHPMAGSEKSGVANASADLLKGASVIMTPTAKTNKLAKDKVKHLWTKLGADVKVMDPDKHDEVMAFVSHLPHLTAFALMRAIPDEVLGFGSTGLKDTTRIAASSSKMWGDICFSNYRNVLKSIDEMAKSLAELRRAIVDKDEATLTQYLNQAKVKRESLDKKQG